MKIGESLRRERIAIFQTFENLVCATNRLRINFDYALRKIDQPDFDDACTRIERDFQLSIILD